MRLKNALIVALVAAWVLTMASMAACREEPNLLTVHDARVSQMIYFSDPRTDLCFSALASANGYGHLLSFTEVPCTDAVRRQIEVFRQESRRYLSGKGE